MQALEFSWFSKRSDRPRRGAGWILLLAALVLQGSSCPPEGDDAGEPNTPADFGESILANPSPVVVAEGGEAVVALDFRSRRPDLFFGGYELEAPTAALETTFDPTRRTAATPRIMDLEIRALPGSAGIHRLRISAGQIAERVERVLEVVVLPRDVTDLPSASAIDGGGFHTLAILGDGEVWAWGRNVEGQLGDDTRVDRVQPVRVIGLPGPAVAVAAGRSHSMALLEDGSIWSWGANDFRQLGAESDLDRDETIAQPVPLACRDRRCDPLPRFTAIDAGRDHSLALDQNGVIWAWGSFGRGQLGRETLGRREGIPFPIAFPGDLSGIVNFVAIAAGDRFSLALEDDGRVWGWGDNRVNQLGDDLENEYEFPIELVGLGPGSATAIAAGSTHSILLTPEGTVRTAGGNAFGQLGVADREGVLFQTVPRVRNVVAVAAGFGHSLVLHEDGTGSTWGLNEFDQLGFPERAPPNFEPNLSLVQGVPLLRAITGGGRHSLGLSRDCPQIWGWGDNGSGQLGIGNTGRNGFAGRTLGIGDRGPGTGLGDCGSPLSVALAGEGRITSDEGQIDCPDDLCSEIYDRNTRVTLTAVEAPNTRFVGWAGDVEATTASVEVLVDDSRNVVARFEPIRQAPIADFTFSPEAPVTGEVVRFDARASSDADGEILSFVWDSPNQPFFDGTGVVFDETFSFTESFDVRLTVTDDEGLVSSVTRPIVVVRPPPGGGGGGGETFQLEIVFVGSGAGRVTLLGGELECTQTCVLEIAPQNLTLFGFQQEGSFFSHFTGCDEAPGRPINECEVDLDSNRRIEVFFE